MTQRLRPAGILLACAILCACSESLPPVPPMAEPLTAAELPGTAESNGCKAMREVAAELHDASGKWHNARAIRGLTESHPDDVDGWLDRLDAIARKEAWDCGTEPSWLAVIPESQDLSSAVALVYEDADAAARNNDVPRASHRAATILLLAARGSGWSLTGAQVSSRHVHAALSVLGKLNVSEIPPETRAEILQAFNLINVEDPFDGPTRLRAERDMTLGALENAYYSRHDHEALGGITQLTRAEEVETAPRYREAMERVMQAWSEPDGIERISIIVDGFQPSGLISPYHEILREMRALSMRMQSTQRRLETLSGD
jgi:hypothetical protein